MNCNDLKVINCSASYRISVCGGNERRLSLAAVMIGTWPFKNRDDPKGQRVRSLWQGETRR